MCEQRVPAVLIVDASNPFAELIRPALERRGFAVYSAKSPDKGLAQFREHHSRIDLVVMDMVAPAAGNFDLAAELERLRPGLPVLYLVGGQQTIARAGIEAQSPGSVLVAPFTEEQFMGRMDGLLDIEMAARQKPDEQLWAWLMEASNRIGADAALLYVYEPRQSALAAAHVAMLRAGNIEYAFRPTNYEACPYSVIVPARDVTRARCMIAAVSAGKRFISAA